MELVNGVYHYKGLKGAKRELLGEAIEAIIILLSPFAPHISEELWEMIGRDGSVHDQTWPNFDEDALKREEVEIVIQVNGKVRDRMVLPLDINKVEMENMR